MSTPTPELLFSLTPLGYGKKEIFERRLGEGFLEAAFGSGEWIVKGGHSYRIVRIWAFFKPDGTVATYEHPKADHGYGSIRGEPYESEYSAKAFEAHKQEWKIRFGTRRNIAETISQWPTPEDIKKRVV